MKPFKVNRDSWHYKLNRNLLNGNGYSDWAMKTLWEPKHNNFCSYWRATSLRLLAGAAAGVMALGGAFMVGYGIYFYPAIALEVVVTLLLAVAIPVGIFTTAMALDYIHTLWKRRKVSDEAKQPSLLGQKYLAHKEKICPMVEFDE